MLWLSKSADPDQTRRLVWVYTFCICPKVPFRMTLANFDLTGSTRVQQLVKHAVEYSSGQPTLMIRIQSASYCLTPRSFLKRSRSKLRQQLYRAKSVYKSSKYRETFKILDLDPSYDVRHLVSWTRHQKCRECVKSRAEVDKILRLRTSGLTGKGLKEKKIMQMKICVEFWKLLSKTY